MKRTILHISDLHFHTYPKKFKEWKSKRILGAMNLVFRRAKQFPLERARSLIQQIQKMDWNHLVISGDLTQLSLSQGFERARNELHPLLNDPKRVSIIPGNHDRYVKQKPGKDFFYQYFGDLYGSDEIHTRKLGNGWMIIGWDSVHANDWLTAAGTVRRETLLATEKIMQSQPKDTKFIIVNHYPLTFPENWPIDPFHELYNLVPVREWILDRPQIRLYLHGHIHRNWIHKLQRESGPELSLVNSASSTAIYRSRPKSSFHLIELDGDEVNIIPQSLDLDAL